MAKTARREIKSLAAHLVNQIAAGEVVERPASVVKEIVENAIDAGSTRVVVELEAGGVELVRVTDDGVGIPESELPLALAPHATSKIREAEDLDRIATMGFRGEALASIASVSRMSVRSRTRQQVGAFEISAEGEMQGGVRPASGGVGTCVSVRNLFFNTPARRKFLRTAQTEQGHCLDVVSTIAIAHPAIGFRATCDGRVVMDLPPGQGPRERALSVLGKELEEQLLEVSADEFDDTRGVALWGLVGTPEIARGTAKGQHLYLNGRAIRDKTVQHAVREAYRGLIEPGRYPTAVLMIEMDPGAVDVNVHPAKAEVRFRDQSMVHGVILRSVRDALRRADLTPSVGGGMQGGGNGAGWTLRGGGGGEGAGAAMFGGGGGGVAAGSGTLLHAEMNAASLVEYLKRPPTTPVRAEALRESMSGEPRGEAAGVAEPVQRELMSQPRRDAMLQVHKSFVVTQDSQGLLIVDQHALHERVMFEALLKRFAKGEDGAEATPLESQRLLVPAVVRSTRTLTSRLDEMQGLLKRIGVACEAVGAEDVAVSAFPTFLFDRGVDPVGFLSELFQKAEGENFEGWDDPSAAGRAGKPRCTKCWT